MEFLRNEVMDFVRSQGDKLLLAVLVALMVGTLIHLVHHEAQSPVIPWLEKSVDMMLGSLLTLITGHALRRDSKQ